MPIDFLQASDDIKEFVDHLYSSGCVLALKDGYYDYLMLDQGDAISLLLRDLHSISNRYWISKTAEDGSHKVLLKLDSCDCISHPRTQGKEERIAGVIDYTVSKNMRSDDAQKLYQKMRRYFQRNYQSAAYRGEKTKGYLGQHYLKLQDAYFMDPDDDILQPGFFSIISWPAMTETLETHMNHLLKGIAVFPLCFRRARYYEDHTLEELQVSFLYREGTVEVNVVKDIIRALTQENCRITVTEKEFRIIGSGFASLKEMYSDSSKVSVNAFFKRCWTEYDALCGRLRF